MRCCYVLGALLLCTLLSSSLFAQPSGKGKKANYANRDNDGVDERLKINMYFLNTSDSFVLADATLARYNNTYSKAVTSEDAGKISNIDENVAIFRDNKLLTVERRPLIDDYDTIFLNIYNLKLRSYKFELLPVHFTAPLLSAYIEDAFTNKKTPVSLIDTTNIFFTVTNAKGSYDSNRFRIIYQPTQYYRSKKSGAWMNSNNWQVSDDSLLWRNAELYPADAVRSTIIFGSDTMFVNGRLPIKNTKAMAGASITVDSGAVLSIKDTGLVMMSSADSAASIGMSAGEITGEAIIERFIPADRSWRLITSPVTGSQTIREAWQENGRNNIGLGTHISGGLVANGFDQTTTNLPSIKVYNNSTNSLVGLPSTLTPLSDKQGYMLFVRGDRTTLLPLGALAPATTTVLRSAGSLRTGTQAPIPVEANGFTLVGNPYASSIDFANLTRSNVPDRFYVWDPKRADVGAYVLLTAADNYAPLVNGGSYNGPNSSIQSGQAFFVEGSGTAGNIVFTETSKTKAQRNVFKNNSGVDEKLQVNLYFYKPDSTKVLSDAIQGRYNTGYSANVTVEDAGKLDNIDENIAIARSGRLLTVERRPTITAPDTMYIKIYNMKLRNYELQISPSNFITPNLTAYLYDAYNNSQVQLNLQDTAYYRFSITSDPATYNAARFKIVYKLSGTLPVSFINAKAYKKEKGIQVEWMVNDEKTTKEYEVERSSDAISFKRIATTIATSNNSYSIFDVAPGNGANFYRIKSIDKNNAINYSKVVRVDFGNSNHTITVYPNPVKSNRFTVELNSFDEGSYTLQLFNVNGQLVYSKKLNHNSSTVSYNVSPASNVPKGIYDLKISNGKTSVTKEIIFK